MRNLLVLLSIVAINSAIRVPNNWRELYPVTYKDLRPRREGGVQHQNVYANTHRFPSIQPEVIISGSRWTPVLPKRSSTKVKKYVKVKPNYYKKHIQPMYKKKKPYVKPEKNVSQNIKQTVPYITYKKTDHFPSSSLFIPQHPLKTFSNIYPQIQKRPKNLQSPDYHHSHSQYPNVPNLSSPGYTNFDNSFNLPITVKPKSNSVLSQEQHNYKPYELDTSIRTKPDSNYVPTFEQPKIASNDQNTYTPNKNIVNYFDSVKNDISPNYAFSGDKRVTYARENNPDNQNSYSAYHKPEENKMENYSPKQNDIGYFSHLYKNYRDEKIFKPEKTDMHYVKEEDPKFERDEVEKPPASTHEVPQEIPTRPIYPGEGLWAQPGLTHRPYISQQTYDNLKEDEVEPDGYDTFLEGQKLFNLTGDGAIQRFRSFPEQHQIGSFIKQHSIDSSKSASKESSREPIPENESESEETEEDEFVPTRLYAQVRASEDMEYLPLEEADDGKLREAIKESKIHTVYTEEGYEDSAYDHAGHEKEAENDEGFEDLQRAKLEKKEKKVPEAKYNLHLPNLHRTKFSYGGELLSDKEIKKIKHEQLGIDDTDVAGTQFEDLPIENIEEVTENEEEEEDEENQFTTEFPMIPKRNNNFISTKETKTMTTKEKDDGNTETEISSKVNIILQPNNSTKSHKYVKIYPKIYKTIRRNKPQADTGNTNYDESNADSEVGQKYAEKEKKLGNVTNFSGIYIEEIPPTTEIPFTKYPSTEYQDIPEEIPITTLPTTAIPKPIKSNNNVPSNNAEEALKDITKEFFKIHKRTKRYVNDFSHLKIEKNDFVPNISHEFGKINDYKKVKYPYYDNYKEKGLNIDSPLRYSQNMNQMPIKTGKKMIFYEEAEKRVPCPEINTSINPIPEKALNEAENKNVEKNEDNYDDEDKDEIEENVSEEKEVNSSRKKREVSEESKSPRLAGLGDKIDCLRARYFGEDPLDSPFFDEVTVGTIEPIFNELKKHHQGRNQEDNNINEIVNHNKAKNNNQDNFDEEKLNNSILKDIKYQLAKQNKIQNKLTASSKENKDINEKKFNDNLNKDISQNLKISNRVHSKTKSTTESVVPTISLLTTPEYTIDLKPKHIYDQIELLEHLPNQEEVNNNNISSSNDIQKERSFSSRQSKAIDEDNIAYESSDDNAMLPEAEELRRRRKIRRKRPPFQIFDINKFLPTTPSPISIFQPITPYPRLPISNIKNAIPQATKLQIFDINKFVPTTPSTKREIITSSTVLPKYKVLSEVFYKDDIKPNEQLHVFTDILNNIKNASQDQQIQQLDTSIESSEPVSVTLNSQTEYAKLKKHTPVYFQDSYLQAYGDQEVDQNYLAPSAISTTTTTTTTTTIKPTTYRRTRYKIKKSPENMAVPQKNMDSHFEQQLKLYIALREAKRKQQQNLININNDYGHTIPVNEDTYDYVDKTTKVMGLMPPGIKHYKTIYHPKRDNSNQLSSPNQINRRVNKFFVMGMKPPPHQKILVYSDFLNKNQLIKKPSLSRGKRSTGRGSYASLSRNRGQQETELEKVAIPDTDDDYVPHRPKNYYYDEKTGKIVYLTTKKPQLLEDDVEEEIEYEEITEPPAPTSKPKQDPIFATATPPPEGKGYIDFVLKLKQNANYIFIPDPTTTEKAVTEKTTTSTLKPILTTPPEFLNILSKVRQSNQYKLIEDKKEKKPTTEAIEEFVDDEEESEDEDIPSKIIQNAPGGQSHDAGEYFGIFDVTDFIPKIKNYLPKTSYDTSKYKTIERPTSKTTTVEDDDNDFEEQNERNTAQKYTVTEVPTSEKSFVIITEEGIVNEDTATKQTEEVPVTIKRRRPTTATSNINTTENPTTKATFLRRRRPTTLRSTRTTTSKETTPRPPPSSTVSVSHEEKIRRVFRRRPTTRRAPTTEFLDEEQDDTTKVLRRRSGTTQQISTEPSTTHKSKTLAERFKTFHRNKKHGGVYKRNDSPSDPIRQTKQVIDVPVNKDVEVIGVYDKTKRHGGNYRKVDDIKEMDEAEDQHQDYDDSVEQVTGSDENSLRISLLPNNEDKEEIDEHNTEQDEQLEGKFLPQKKGRTSLVSNKKKSDKDSKGKFVTEATLSRLTDVVPKPEAFYNDPTLPRSINMLADIDKLSSVEIKDILSSTDSSEILVNRDENEDNVYVLDPITKRPIIIKDPSKRLYFYAPV